MQFLIGDNISFLLLAKNYGHLFFICHKQCYFQKKLKNWMLTQKIREKFSFLNVQGSFFLLSNHQTSFLNSWSSFFLSFNKKSIFSKCVRDNNNFTFFWHKAMDIKFSGPIIFLKQKCINVSIAAVTITVLEALA